MEENKEKEKKSTENISEIVETKDKKNDLNNNNKENRKLIIILIIVAILLGVGGFFLGKSLQDETKCDLENKENSNSDDVIEEEATEKEENSEANEENSDNNSNDVIEEDATEKEEVDSEINSDKEENSGENEEKENEMAKSENTYDFPVDIEEDIKRVYHVSFSDSQLGINVSIQNDPKSVKLNISETIYEYFRLENAESYSGIKTFNSNVKQVIVGRFGHGAGAERIFFLLEDGTIEYIYLLGEIKDDNFKNKTNEEKFAPKKINEIDNVEYIYAAEVETRPSWYYSTIALRSDGTIYDLSEFTSKYK